jgi:hypothetical protein
LFTHYGYDVRKKNGGISALSSKIIKDKDAISKADADDLLDFLRNNGSTDAAKLARIRKLRHLQIQYLGHRFICSKSATR